MTWGAVEVSQHVIAGARTAPVVRPQPLGAFPLPAGLLLIPGGEETEPCRKELVAGRIPAHWPAALRAHELAFAGDLAGAREALRGDDPVTRYNRFVIDPEGEDEERLRADLGEPLGALVDLVRFTLGRTDEPPALGAADGEIAALILSAQATHAVSRGEPGLALRLLGAAADIRKGAEGPSPEVVAELRRALGLLKDTDLRVGQAELHLALALTLHEAAGGRRDLLVEAVREYRAALRLVTSEEAPEVWAAAHLNLATAYLTMPMTEASDRLRQGIAVQSLRSALKVYRPETHPRQWASAQLNLANALVYAPSRHREQNLREAVELYEAVLKVRDAGSDPLGRARVLANQGNALAHLGMFGEARERLHEARSLFAACGDEEAVRTVDGLLGEIAAHTGAGTAEG